jgi:hypothetical protein
LVVWTGALKDAEQAVLLVVWMGAGLVALLDDVLAAG